MPKRQLSKMMRKIIALHLFSFLVLTSNPAISGWFGQENYDECILESMKGVTTKFGAHEIARACRGKFPKDKKQNANARELSREEISQLTGRANHKSSWFTGTIYNGNKRLTVSAISIRLSGSSSGEKISRIYTERIVIPPESADEIRFRILQTDEGKDSAWNIAGAKGY